MLNKTIRALYDEDTITVYQAYNKYIANSAVRAQTFAPPFKRERMTWIKPSFLWMMYRSGWAMKDENQACILAVKMKRSGFEWALGNSCNATPHGEDAASWRARMNVSPVRVQWDPEKDILLRALPYRSIQIGLSGIAVDKYLDEWITEITDITAHCKTIHALVLKNELKTAKELLPRETLYPLSEPLATHTKADYFTL